LKLWTADNNGLKKVREAPRSMAALAALVKANVKDPRQEYRVWYQDEA